MNCVCLHAIQIMIISSYHVWYAMYKTLHVHYISYVRRQAKHSIRFNVEWKIMCLLSFDTNDTNNHINHWKICGKKRKKTFSFFRSLFSIYPVYPASYSVLVMMRTVCCVLTMLTADYQHFASIFLLLIRFCFEAIIRKSWQQCHLMAREREKKSQTHGHMQRQTYRRTYIGW